MQYRRRSWVQYRAQWLVTPVQSCLGRHGFDVTGVQSAMPLCGAVVQLISREQSNAPIGRDVLSRKLVEAEATGLFCRAGLERGGESVSRSRLYARGRGRDGELVPRPRPFARGLERDGKLVGHPRPLVRGL